jgi:hypothetical protein
MPSPGANTTRPFMVKKVHYCWFGSAQPRAVMENIAKWKILNPDFTFCDPVHFKSARSKRALSLSTLLGFCLTGPVPVASVYGFSLIALHGARLASGVSRTTNLIEDFLHPVRLTNSVHFATLATNSPGGCRRPRCHNLCRAPCQRRRIEPWGGRMLPGKAGRAGVGTVAIPRGVRLKGGKTWQVIGF